MKVSPAVATWARAMLGVLLGIAIMEWPYGRSCGFLLFFYLTAVVALIVTGTWAAVFSWRGRLGAAHVVALGTILWGTVLGAYEVLPRAGYAKSAAAWWCTESSVGLDAPWLALTSPAAR